MIKITLKNPDLERRLQEESEASGQDPETLAQEILDRGLSMQKFRRIREKMAPQAKKAGFADEDTILRTISWGFFDTNVLVSAFTAPQGICFKLFEITHLSHPTPL